MTGVAIQIGCVDGSTPTIPSAKRGRATSKDVTETAAQLDAGLIWDWCPFCDRHVLVDAFRRTRERCTCGAVRTHATVRGYDGDRHYNQGWRRGKKTWWRI